MHRLKLISKLKEAAGDTYRVTMEVVKSVFRPTAYAKYVSAESFVTEAADGFIVTLKLNKAHTVSELKKGLKGFLESAEFRGLDIMNVASDDITFSQTFFIRVGKTGKASSW